MFPPAPLDFGEEITITGLWRKEGFPATANEINVVQATELQPCGFLKYALHLCCVHLRLVD
jgi:hypothetical protein